MTVVNYFLELLHREVLGDVSHVSGMYAAPIFRLYVVRLVSCCVYVTFVRKGM
jgi:hypothetical protein